MLSSLKRAGRAIALTLRPVRGLGTVGRLVLALLALVAAGAYATWKQAFQVWVTADWSHLALVIVSLMLLSSFIAVTSILKQLDDLARVRVFSDKVDSVEVREILNSEERGRPVSLRNVLVARLPLRLRNDGREATRLFFPHVELYRRKSRLSRWRVVPLDMHDIAVRSVLKGARGVGDLWLPVDQRYDVPPHDEIDASLWVVATLRSDPPAIFREQLELRVMLDIFGQEKTIQRIPLPKLSLPFLSSEEGAS